MTMHMANNFGSRLVGWMGRRRLDPDEALWLRPCRAVHTFAMRLPIDVVFLDSSGIVLRVVPGLRPWRACADRRARSVLELPAGAAMARGLHAGSRIRLPVASCRPPPTHRAGRMRRLAIALGAAALLAAACRVAPVHAGAPLIDEPAAPDAPVTIVFQTEWTPDPRRLVEDAMPPEPDRTPARTGTSRWFFSGAAAGTASLPIRAAGAGPAHAGGAATPATPGAKATAAPAAVAIAAPVHLPGAAALPAALPTHGAGVAGAPGLPGAASLAAAGCPASLLPPMALLRPLAPDTLARAVEEADGMYHAKHWGRALEAFCGLVEIDPVNRLAWLRIGNLQHQRNRLPPAAEAYRQAARAADAGDTTEPTPVRARALANLMAVALELARDSFGELRQLNLPPQASAMQLVEQVGIELRALVPDGARPAAAARSGVEILGARPARIAEPAR
jgi:uncharacterized membrane protein (UPF0127 family)